jgi:hypothetical protein
VSVLIGKIFPCSIWLSTGRRSDGGLGSSDSALAQEGCVLVCEEEKGKRRGKRKEERKGKNKEEKTENWKNSKPEISEDKKIYGIGVKINYL